MNSSSSNSSTSSNPSSSSRNSSSSSRSSSKQLQHGHPKQTDGEKGRAAPGGIIGPQWRWDAAEWRYRSDNSVWDGRIGSCDGLSTYRPSTRGYAADASVAGEKSDGLGSPTES